ncbi:hypothetical protein [Rhodococcoides fascians]|uniref:hypothetical protein n=1 Tax=Rhodococcoides fascians TaxID=1828 RepID=UPI00050C0DB0|nr:hypothetical protein [Rhodococcus fascians]
MTAAQRVGEIDADAIYQLLFSPIGRLLSPGHQQRLDDEKALNRFAADVFSGRIGSAVHFVDEVHVLDDQLLKQFDPLTCKRVRPVDEFAIVRHHAAMWPLTSPWPTTSPAAASEGMPAVLPAKLPLAAGAENEVPGAGIPPPRPGPPNQTPRTPTDLKGQQ